MVVVAHPAPTSFCHAIAAAAAATVSSPPDGDSCPRNPCARRCASSGSCSARAVAAAVCSSTLAALARDRPWIPSTIRALEAPRATPTGRVLRAATEAAAFDGGWGRG